MKTNSILILVRLRHCIIGITQANKNKTLEPATSTLGSQNIRSRALKSFLDTSTKGQFPMASHKVSYSRRPQMLRVAAEAPAILAPETDRLENSSWPSKTVFFHDYPASSNDGLGYYKHVSGQPRRNTHHLSHRPSPSTPLN